MPYHRHRGRRCECSDCCRRRHRRRKREQHKLNREARKAIESSEPLLRAILAGQQHQQQVAALQQQQQQQHQQQQHQQQQPVAARVLFNQPSAMPGFPVLGGAQALAGVPGPALPPQRGSVPLGFPQQPPQLLQASALPTLAQLPQWGAPGTVTVYQPQETQASPVDSSRMTVVNAQDHKQTVELKRPDLDAFVSVIRERPFYFLGPVSEETLDHYTVDDKAVEKFAAFVGADESAGRGKALKAARSYFGTPHMTTHHLVSMVREMVSHKEAERVNQLFYHLECPFSYYRNPITNGGVFTQMMKRSWRQRFYQESGVVPALAEELAHDEEMQLYAVPVTKLDIKVRPGPNGTMDVRPELTDSFVPASNVIAEALVTPGPAAAEHDRRGAPSSPSSSFSAQLRRTATSARPQARFSKPRVSVSTNGTVNVQTEIRQVPKRRLFDGEEAPPAGPAAPAVLRTARPKLPSSTIELAPTRPHVVTRARTQAADSDEDEDAAGTYVRGRTDESGKPEPPMDASTLYKREAERRARRLERAQQKSSSRVDDARKRMDRVSNFINTTLARTAMRAQRSA